MQKERITVTVDRDLLEAASAAVQAGRARSVSAWVSDAMVEKRERDQRHQALGEAIAAYEAEYGEITQEMMDEVEAGDLATAVRVRPTRRGAA